MNRQFPRTVERQRRAQRHAWWQWFLASANNIILGIIGTLILTVVFDPSSGWRIGFVFASGVVFVLVIWVTRWLHRRWRTRRLGPSVAVSEGDVTPRPILVVLVSDQLTGSDKVAIEHHLGRRADRPIAGDRFAPALRECFLVHTASEGSTRAKNARLQEYDDQPGVLGSRVDCHPLRVEDEYSVQASREVIAAILEDLSRRSGKRTVTPDDVIVDITGGTKTMTAGAVLACLDYGFDAQYVQYPFDPVSRRQIFNEPERTSVRVVDLRDIARGDLGRSVENLEPGSDGTNAVE